MSRHEKKQVARTAMRGLGRATVLVVLLVGLVATSVALASVGRERPSTEALGRDQGVVAEPETMTQYGPIAGQAQTSSGAKSDGPSPAELVSAEDRRVLDLVRRVPFGAQPYRVDSTTSSGNGADTLVLTPRSEPYSLSSLINLGSATRLTDRSVYLTDSVFVAPGAELNILDDRKLRMRSDDEGFVSIVAWKGGLELRGRDENSPLQITSWDLDRADADTDVSNGRSYIRTVKSDVDVSDISARSLGFWSGATGGLAVMHSQRFSIRTSSLIDDHYGLFLSDVRGATIDEVVVKDSTLEGILVHGGSRDLEFRRTTVLDSGGHGVAVTRGSEELAFSEMTLLRNAGDGVRIDGSSLAEGASAGGAATRRYGSVGITDSTIGSNGASGVSIVDASGVSITGSTVTENVDGVVVRGAARDVVMQDNIVQGSSEFGIAVTDGPSGVDITGNTVDEADTGIAVRGAVAVLMDNSVASARQHGISLVGDAGGSQVVNNTLAGRGPSAISLSRIDSPGEVLVNGNAVAGWDVDRDLTLLQRLEENPLLLLWIPLLLVPLLMTLAARRRTRRVRNRAAGPSDPLHAVVHPSVSVPRPRTPAASVPKYVLDDGPADPASLPTRTKVTVVS